jgi:hypothetical protein
LELPKKHHARTNHTSFVFVIFSATVDTGIPVCTHLFAMSVCPPPYLLNLDTLLHLGLHLFWADPPGCETMGVRDIYRMEFEIFRLLD